MHYLDTSVILPILFNEARTLQVQAFVQARSDLAVSAWNGVELESALNRLRREGHVTAEGDRRARALYRRFIATATVATVGLEHAYAAARVLLQGSAPLRAPDALHLGTAQVHGATLVTGDRQLARAAQHHRVPVHVL